MKGLKGWASPRALNSSSSACKLRVYVYLCTRTMLTSVPRVI